VGSNLKKKNISIRKQGTVVKELGEYQGGASC